MDSQFEGRVHHSLEDMAAEGQAAGHMMLTSRKQSEVSAGVWGAGEVLSELYG